MNQLMYIKIKIIYSILPFISFCATQFCLYINDTIIWQHIISVWPEKSTLLKIDNYFNSKVELEPCCPVWWIINEAHVFKELVGDYILLLYEAVHRVAFSSEPLGHGVDEHLGIAFPSVLWKSVQDPQCTVVIEQKPGQWLPLFVGNATRWEVDNEVFNDVVSLFPLSKFPSFIHQVSMGEVEWGNPWFKLTVERKIRTVSIVTSMISFSLKWKSVKYSHISHFINIWLYLTTAGVAR